MQITPRVRCKEWDSRQTAALFDPTDYPCEHQEQRGEIELIERAWTGNAATWRERRTPSNLVGRGSRMPLAHSEPWNIEPSKGLIRPNILPSRWDQSAPRLGAGFSLATPRNRSTTGSPHACWVIREPRPTKSAVSAPQRSPLFTTSTVLSRSELVCARQRNPASN